MTRKEHLALEYFLSRHHYPFDVRAIFLEGFEAAKKEILDKYFNTPGDHYNKQRTLDPEEIQELGNEEVHQDE